MPASEESTGNQTTTYTYGTTLTDSDVARNDILVRVAYPDSSGSSDTVTTTYNRLGQKKRVTYDTSTGGTPDLSQSRTANEVNEITAISGSPSWVTPSYDDAGNMIEFPDPSNPSRDLNATYDAWNRLMKVDDGTDTLVEYRYDGRRRRVIRLGYTGGTLSETRHFYLTSGWQDIEERVGASTSADMQYVWGQRYIDELVCRDDATPQRLYVAQDANFNVTAIIEDDGDVVERYVFDAYGRRLSFDDLWVPTGNTSFGWNFGKQCSRVENDSLLYLVRHRPFSVLTGQWLTRDPAGYSAGLNLFETFASNPESFIDPSGLDIIPFTPDPDDRLFDPILPRDRIPSNIPTVPAVAPAIDPRRSVPGRIEPRPPRRTAPRPVRSNPRPISTPRPWSPAPRLISPGIGCGTAATVGTCTLTATGVGAIVCCEVVVAGVTTGILCH